MNRAAILLLLTLSATLIGSGALAKQQPQTMITKPPVAKRIPKKIEIHGYTLIDDYFWLRDDKRENPDVIGYLKAESEYADAWMKPTEKFQQALYQEILGRIKETDEQVPYRQGDYYYYSRTEQGRQYPIMCRRKGSLQAPEEVTLDMNRMAEGRKFFSLGAYQVSPDGNLLAFSTDVIGFRQFKLHVKDLATGRIVENIADRVTSIAWANDNRTVFYTQEDPVAKRSHKFFRHMLGGEAHDLLFEETDELYRLYASATRSKGYVMMVSASSTTSEIHYISADKPAGALLLFLPRRENHEYYVDHIGGSFYIRTNDQGKNFRLVTAPVEAIAPKNWKELIPHRKGVMLEDIDCFSDHYVAVERENGIPKLQINDLATGKSHYISFPEPVYVVYPSANAEFTTPKYRFSYESMVTPDSVFDYDLKTHRRKLLKQQPVLGGYDSSMYKSERIYATAADGVKVPISLVYRKGLKRAAAGPLLLEGYGSYGISNDIDFSSQRLSLLDRGLIYAVAHIRGGGDLGKDWHDQGKMMAKKNTFTDFIACAEHLIQRNYTTKDGLVITGGSAGGLLMGSVANMRPDLFKAVVSYVPFVDVVNTMLDTSLPLTVGEYLEWGNPNDKAAFDYMRSYSPYDNVEAKAYPAMLVRTSLHDSQVGYFEPAKYVAKLRALKTDSAPLLFKVKLEPGGHGGASGRYDRLKDTAYDYAFILRQFDVTK
ncbi:MAG: S9 family peptidase [Blastocatellia bacterium]